MMIVGLTGSIGMGKSTISSQFAHEGAACCDADQIVHQLLASDEAVHESITKRWPEVIEDGNVNRQLLGKAVFGNDVELKALESILHPRVVEKENAFIEEAKNAGKWLVVLDIPLLFETGAETRMDKVVVVSAPAEMQRERVMRRPGMTEEKFTQILSKQTPDAEKRTRADFVVETDKGLDASLMQVKIIISELRKLDKEKHHAGNLPRHGNDGSRSTDGAPHR